MSVNATPEFQGIFNNKKTSYRIVPFKRTQHKKCENEIVYYLGCHKDYLL